MDCFIYYFLVLMMKNILESMFDVVFFNLILVEYLKNNISYMYVIFLCLEINFK